MLKRSYVHLSHHISMESLLSKISQMRKDGPKKLVVRYFLMTLFGICSLLNGWLATFILIYLVHVQYIVYTHVLERLS